MDPAQQFLNSLSGSGTATGGVSQDQTGTDSQSFLNSLNPNQGPGQGTSAGSSAATAVATPAPPLPSMQSPTDAVSQGANSIYNPIASAVGANPRDWANPDARSMSSDVLGFGSIAQIPGRVMAISGQEATAQGLDKSRMDLADSNLKLIQALPTIQDPQRRAAIEAQIHDNMTLMDAMNQQARGVNAGELSGEEVAGAAGKAALTTLLGMGATSELGNAGLGGKILQGAVIGAPAMASQAMSQNASTPDVLKAGAQGAGFGALLSGALEAGKSFLLKGLPRLLQYTSSVPDALLSEEVQRPADVAAANAELQKNGELGVLKKVQTAVQTQRTNLSAEWDAGAKVLGQQYADRPFDMSSALPASKSLGLFTEYGLTPPANVTSMGAQDVLDFNKELNSMLTGKAAYSPDFADLRAFRNDWQAAMTKQGDLGNGINPLQTFLDNYGAKSDIVNGMNSLVPSLGHTANTNPKVLQRGLNLLKNGSTMNKSAFLDAIQQFEKLSGFPVRAYMEALQTQGISPPSTFGKSGLMKFFQTLVGGPKGAAFLTRAGSTIANAPINEAVGNIAKEAVIGSGSVAPAAGAAVIGAGTALGTAGNIAQNAAAPFENLANPPQDQSSQ